MEELRVSRDWTLEHCEQPGLLWAPIRSTQEPPSAGILLIARSLGFAALLGLLWFGLERSLLQQARQQAAALAAQESRRTIAVSLAPPRASERVQPGPSPKGAGHVRGTDSIDPELLRAALQQRLPGPVTAEDSDRLGTLPTGEGGTRLENLDLSLPLAAGGTGRARGSGQDATRGGLKVDPQYDYRLVVLHQELAMLKPPYSAEEASIPVVVLISIGADGVPLRVRPISGPKSRFAEVIAAAMKWRFEPLGPHGLTAPFDLRLHFNPKIFDRKKEILPVH